MLTLGTTFAGTAYAMSGKEKAKEQGPPINAGSKDEEQFIQFVNPHHKIVYSRDGVADKNNSRDFIKQATGEGEKAKQ